MKKVTKIVLTGGPSGGKTHALKALREELEKLGLDVICVTESAEGLISEGFDRSRSVYEFQKEIALCQLAGELEAEKRAKDNSVIICDRGLMDCRVYLDDEEFERLKKELGLTDIELRDRYDAAFHLDSTSSDTQSEYHSGNVRTETREQAELLNEKSLRAWCGNPHYRFIPVKSTFEKKLELLLKEVKAFLGIPKPLEIERKFLIEYPDTNKLLSFPCCKVKVEQTYLFDANGRYRLRKRGENGSFIYIKTVKRKISETVREEIEQRLSESEYNELMKSGNKIGSIKKDRYCLMYGGVYYEIDVFPFWKNQAYLEIELHSEEERIELPEFIKVIREVTYDPGYKNYALCMKIPEEDCKKL